MIITQIYVVIRCNAPQNGYFKPDVRIAYNTEEAAKAWKEKQPIPSYYAVVPVELVTHTGE